MKPESITLGLHRVHIASNVKGVDIVFRLTLLF